jgi:hypothetical protein
MYTTRDARSQRRWKSRIPPFFIIGISLDRGKLIQAPKNPLRLLAPGGAAELQTV